MQPWLEPLYDAEAMRAVDRWAIEEQGVAEADLIEAAGTALAEAVAELAPPDLGKLETTLRSDAAITHVVCVHNETTTGMLNPLAAIARTALRLLREDRDALDAARRQGDAR